MKKYLEQRLYRRRHVDLDAEVSVEVKTWDKAKTHLIPVKVINLSLQGCSFITHTVILNGRHLFLEDIESKEIEIQMYLPKNLITIPAKVIWFDYSEEYRGFKVGLSFEPVKGSKRDFLKKYLSLKNSDLKK